MVDNLIWQDHQDFESGWWGDCANTYGEETKQLTYAHRMGMITVFDEGHWPSYDLGGKSIMDIGGGPASILLKCKNFKKAIVVDPCTYPKWVHDRYSLHGITFLHQKGEDIDETNPMDEAWIYNVLQHVDDPEKLVRNAVRTSRILRIFDWLDTPPWLGHPHTIHREDLYDWISGRPLQHRIEEMQGENGCQGTAFYGVFARVEE